MEVRSPARSRRGKGGALAPNPATLRKSSIESGEESLASAGPTDPTPPAPKRCLPHCVSRLQSSNVPAVMKGRQSKRSKRIETASVVLPPSLVTKWRGLRGLASRSRRAHTPGISVNGGGHTVGQHQCIRLIERPGEDPTAGGALCSERPQRPSHERKM